MTEITGAFRTLAGDEIDPADPAMLKPGHAFWSAMELLGPHWFVIERGDGIESEVTRHRYFLTTVHHAIALIRDLGAANVRLLACVSSTSKVDRPASIGEVVEVLTSPDCSQVLLRYQSGAALLLVGEDCRRAEDGDDCFTSVFQAPSRDEPSFAGVRLPGITNRPICSFKKASV